MDAPSISPPNDQALFVTPLNSMPYIDPLASHGHEIPLEPEVDTEPAKDANPALIYLPSEPPEEEVNRILSITKNAVGLTGSAALGTIGPLVGKLDVGESEDEYMFRVSLPGVAREDFTCDVAPDGQILIKGVTTTGEKTVYKESMKFEMVTQNLCPPGRFSISFKLPGPVDSQEFTAHFGIDGVFEGTVKKRILPS